MVVTLTIPDEVFFLSNETDAEQSSVTEGGFIRSPINQQQPIHDTPPPIMKNHLRSIVLVLGLGAASTLISCTPGEKGAVVGGAIGAGTGALVGDGTGALVGGAVGAVAGSAIAKNKARKRYYGY